MYQRGDAYEHVLIKDYYFEQSNAPGVENKLSFTWQFADGRQTPYRVSLYTNTFTKPFNMRCPRRNGETPAGRGE